MVLSVAPAEKSDAANLADIAGHGLPSRLWHSAKEKDDNPARRLYEAFGFEAAGTEPFLAFGGSRKQTGEWVVMRRPVKG